LLDLPLEMKLKLVVELLFFLASPEEERIESCSSFKVRTTSPRLSLSD